MALGRKPIEIVEEGKHQLLTKAAHWGRIYLKDIAKVQNGYAFSSANFVKSGGMGLIRIRDIDNESTFDNYSGKYSDEFVVRKGDILVGMDGDFKTAIWKGADSLLNQRVCRIIPISESYDSKFLFLCLQPYLDAINEETSSVTVKHLSSRTIEEIPLPYPPLSEQRAIVTKIEELLSDLENGKQQLLKAQEQLKVYRQSLLKATFEGRLNYDFCDFDDSHDSENTASSPENHLNHMNHSHHSSDSLPKGWKWVKLGEVLNKIQIGPFGTQLHKEDYISNGIPLINPMHIHDGRIEADSSFSIPREKRDSLSNYILLKGDVIMGRRGEMGRAALVTEKENGWFCGTGSLFFRPNPKNLNSHFLYYYLRSQQARKYLDENAGGTTMSNLNLKIVRDIPLLLPSITEQQTIVDEIDSKLTVCDKIEETITQSLAQAETLEQSILKKAFEGKLI